MWQVVSDIHDPFGGCCDWCPVVGNLLRVDRMLQSSIRHRIDDEHFSRVLVINRALADDENMHLAGVLPEDAPDPRAHHAELLRQMPIPVIEPVAQRSIEVADVGVNFASDSDGHSSMTAGISVTLWRNTDDRSDPANFVGRWSRRIGTARNRS